MNSSESRLLQIPTSNLKSASIPTLISDTGQSYQAAGVGVGANEVTAPGTSAKPNVGQTKPQGSKDKVKDLEQKGKSHRRCRRANTL